VGERGLKALSFSLRRRVLGSEGQLDRFLKGHVNFQAPVVVAFWLGGFAAWLHNQRIPQIPPNPLLVYFFVKTP
jgi:hypothetical protein